ncbi:MAG TPA: type I-B CRISPR-associated protein Cas7/Csh2 [Candidatus Atribacteria bacterium]|nr:type I-B CRISPR-associated protein Cas7/Csh2 [Candidatus Atribacteria bacterium]HQE25051.1 type I-B CRISPR-associated protein Cas7/Csh2 [Candidatus Atribacteria bacterium]
MSVIQNRSEILFLYDVTNANPNGDPVDENKPRIDEETGINLVSDVRLKRTIRDYLYDYLGKDIFVREIRDDNGNLKTKEERLKDFDSSHDLIEKCIDIRLFGATTAVKDQTMALTGPVQFKYGRSLHRVDLTYVKGTTVMPSQADRKQGTFTERYILPYSLIAFWGVVNEKAAQAQNLPLTCEDVDLMMEAIWNGTKNLISGSKFGQTPRFLLQIIYKGGNFYIGELDKRIAIQTAKEEEKIRDISELQVEISPLIKALQENQDKIEEVRVKADNRIVLAKNGEPIGVDGAFSGLPIKSFPF